MIVKVKEPVPAEYDLLRPGQLLFTYLHLAADEPLTRALMRNECRRSPTKRCSSTTASLPLLTPMSEVAGRMAVQVGAHYLERTHGGSGTLLGGVPGVPGANVVVIGGGVVGTNAAQIALGMGANVTIVDRNRGPAAPARHGAARPGQHAGLEHGTTSPTRCSEADLVIGGGADCRRQGAEDRHPRRWSPSMRPGSVVVDVAIDQGGCIATAAPDLAQRSDLSWSTASSTTA